MSLWLAFLIGLLAFCTAHAFGIPLWRDWEPGDAADFGVLAFFIALELGRLFQKNPRISNQ